jgi:hypothetical protein
MLVRDNPSLIPYLSSKNYPMVFIIFLISVYGLLVLCVPINIYRYLCFPLKLWNNFYEFTLSIRVSLSDVMKITNVYSLMLYTDYWISKH